MKRRFLLAALAGVVLSMQALAQSGFDGTWKVNLNKVDFAKKPDMFLLQNGTYECKTCAPPIKVKADGTDQSVTGYPYFNTVAIKVINDHEIEETNKNDGKVVSTSTMTVSPDGNTAAVTFSDSSNTNGGPPVTGKGEETRVAKGPAGSHAISGSWQMGKLDSLSENGVVWTYKVNGDQITMNNPTGQSYTAKLNGTDAPMKGDPGITTVSVKMIGKNTLEETDKRGSKVIGIQKMTLAPDGKSAKISSEDKLQNRTTEYEATKQ